MQTGRTFNVLRDGQLIAVVKAYTPWDHNKRIDADGVKRNLLNLGWWQDIHVEKRKRERWYRQQGHTFRRGDHCNRPDCKIYCKRG